MLALAVILFCLAGLILGSGGVMLFLAPIGVGPIEILVITGVFVGITAILWAIGSAFLRFRRWRAHLGWVMAGAALMDLMSVAMVGAGLMDENARQAYGREAVRQFENANLGLGFGFLIVLGVAGALLIWAQSRRDTAAMAADESAVAETFR